MQKNFFSIDIQRPIPAYQQLEESLRQRITSGELSPGTRLPVEREFAVQLGLSRGTVRKALDSLVSEGLVVRRQGFGNFVRQDAVVRPLAIVLPEGLSKPLGYMGGLLQIFVRHAAAQGIELLLRGADMKQHSIFPSAEIHLVPEDENAVARAARSQRVISVDRLVRKPRVTSVVYDNPGGSEMIVAALANLGHRQIGFIEAEICIDAGQRLHTNCRERRKGIDAGQRLHTNCRERRKGLETSAAKHGVQTWVRGCDHDKAQIMELMEREFRKKSHPTAFFAMDEVVGNCIRISAEKCGLKVPADISIATFREADDEPAGGIDWTGPAVSINAMVRAAFDCVQKGTPAPEGPEEIVVNCDWRPGTTVAPPKP